MSTEILPTKDNQPITDDQTSTLKEMSFFEHLEALRGHLVRSAIAVLVFAVLAFIFKEFIFDKIILAPKHADFLTYRVLCRLGSVFGLEDDLCIREIIFNLINTDMSGQFTTHLAVSIIAGIVIASPLIIWEFWRFVKPALYEKEIAYARGIVFYCSILFSLGILFGYFLITPLSVNFFGTYQVSEEISNQITLLSYIKMVTTTTFATGVVFELPIIIYFLAKLGIVTPSFLRKYRRHAIVLILLLAAIITPPDVLSQLLVSMPLIILYEASIYIAKLVVKDTV